jgi:hypothetical protein
MPENVVKYRENSSCIIKVFEKNGDILWPI